MLSAQLALRGTATIRETLRYRPDRTRPAVDAPEGRVAGCKALQAPPTAPTGAVHVSPQRTAHSAAREPHTPQSECPSPFTAAVPVLERRHPRRSRRCHKPSTPNNRQRHDYRSPAAESASAKAARRWRPRAQRVGRQEPGRTGELSTAGSASPARRSSKTYLEQDLFKGDWLSGLFAPKCDWLSGLWGDWLSGLPGLGD